MSVCLFVQEESQKDYSALIMKNKYHGIKDEVDNFVVCIAFPASIHPLAGPKLEGIS